MRALCGAIITAGALIGLGFTAVGLGYRYAGFMRTTELGGGELVYLHFKQIDTPLMLILVVLLITLVIGLGIAFVGLAFHHERRHHERLHRLGHGAAHDTGIPRPLP